MLSTRKPGLRDGLCGFLLMVFGVAAVAADPPAPWYRNGAEEANPMSFWVKAQNLQYTVNDLALSDVKPHSGKRSIKLDVTLNGEHYCYFKIPVNCRLKPDESYYASGYLRVEQFPSRGRNKIGLGANVVMWYGKGRKENTSGTYGFGDVNAPTADWVYMESGELGRNIGASAVSVGLPSDTLDVEHLYLGIEGTFENERVVAYVDDLALSREPRNPERPVEVRDYPILREVFPYGIYGGSGGWRDSDAAGAFGETWPDALWRDLPNWKSRYLNTVMGEVPELFADSDPVVFDRLATALSIFEKNRLHLVPAAYLTRYYRADLTPAACEKVIREQIPRFKDSRALLAWMTIDEPAGSSALEDYLWGRKLIESIDPLHPVITGGNSYDYAFARHRPVALFDWYQMRENRYAPWSVGGITAMIYRDASGPVWYIAPAFHNITGEYTRPTPAELRLMSYAALANGAKGLFFFCWRERPLWMRMAGSGVVDVVGSDTPLWDEVRDMGRQITAVGPLLLNTKVESNTRLKVQAETIKITWDEEIPAIAASVLAEPGGEVQYLVIYNNDPKRRQEGAVQLPAGIVRGRGLYDLYALAPAPGWKPNEGNALRVALEPGEGRIYLLAKEGDYRSRADRIQANRLCNEKETVKYELHQAWLAGVASPALVKRYREADSTPALQGVRQALAGETAASAPYTRLRADLDRIQKNLSELNTLFEQKVTSLESTVPHPAAFVKRDFNAADPVVKTYLDAFLDLGHLYYRQRNLCLTGRCAEIAGDVGQLDTWVTALLATARKTFAGRPPAAPAGITTAETRAMRERLDTLWAKKSILAPDPDDMLRNNGERR